MSAVEKLPAPIQVFRQELVGMEPQFAAALPKHIPAERFGRVVMTAVGQNPDLLKCTRRSLWNAAMKAAQDGLLPDGREGAIVAYKDSAQWMPMVAGLRKKVRNSGEIATWECHVVYERDEFDFALGDDPRILHRPALGDRGKPIGAYSIAVLKSGERSREFMSVDEIEAVRSRSRAARNGPWVSDWAEMARKTVARRHAKVLPMSTDLDDLIRRDDELYDFSAGRDVQKAEPPATLAGRLDALARLPAAETVEHDADGVVIEATADAATEPPVKTTDEHDHDLAEAAKRGSAALQSAWNRMPPDAQKALRAALDRRHKPAAVEADKASEAAA